VDTSVYVVPICEVVGVAAVLVETVLLLPPPTDPRVGECACSEAPSGEFLASNVGASVTITTSGFGIFSNPLNAIIERIGEGIVILNINGDTGWVQGSSLIPDPGRQKNARGGARASWHFFHPKISDRRLLF
jgi:hypothetical protein